MLAMDGLFVFQAKIHELVSGLVSATQQELEMVRPRQAAWARQLSAIDTYITTASSTLAKVEEVHSILQSVLKESRQAMQPFTAALDQARQVKERLESESRTAHANQPEVVNLHRAWELLGPLSFQVGDEWGPRYCLLSPVDFRVAFIVW